MTYTIQNIAINLRKDKISILEITQLMLKNIKANDLNAFISVFEQESIQKAKELDTQLKKLSQDEKEQLPLLYGIPLAIKDLFCTIDGKTTAGSAMLRNYESPIESTVTSKLKQLNSIFIGKTNLDEFAMGSSNETSYFKYVKNPIDPTRTPGGSSGGSAAAIGANQAIAALGTDTGGSVRLPASYTGSVAMRPTYGSCSRYGIAAFASSLDQPGPMTKNIKDNAILLN
ncbi:MAG: amidase, partial [Pseudomonadota bacterium]